MISPKDVSEHIAYISAALDRLAAGKEDLSRCVEISKQFETLRDEYRRHAEALADHMPQLVELSKRFDEMMAGLIPQVIDRFHEINQRIRQDEKEKDYWRSLLIRRSEETRQENLNGQKAAVRVRCLHTRTLPRAGTDERDELEEVIRNAGHWDKVSQLSRTLLQKAADEKRLDGADMAAIHRLCPPAVTHQVSCHELGA